MAVRFGKLNIDEPIHANRVHVKSLQCHCNNEGPDTAWESKASVEIDVTDEPNTDEATEGKSGLFARAVINVKKDLSDGVTPCGSLWSLQILLQHIPASNNSLTFVFPFAASVPWTRGCKAGTGPAGGGAAACAMSGAAQVFIDVVRAPMVVPGTIDFNGVRVGGSQGRGNQVIPGSTEKDAQQMVDQLAEAGGFGDRWGKLVSGGSGPSKFVSKEIIHCPAEVGGRFPSEPANPGGDPSQPGTPGRPGGASPGGAWVATTLLARNRMNAIAHSGPRVVTITHEPSSIPYRYD